MARTFRKKLQLNAGSMEYTVEHIALRDIDTTNTLFCHRYRIDGSAITNPAVCPIVVVKRHAYVVISGFRRIDALRVRGGDMVTALVIMGDYADKDLFLLALEYNRTTILRDIDKAQVIGMALQGGLFPYDEVVKEIMPILAIGQSRKMVERYEALYQLSPILKDYCWAYGFGMKFALCFDFFSREEREYIFNSVLSNVFFTESEMKKFTELVCELSIMRQCSMQDLLSASAVRDIFAMDVIDKEKARLLLTWLWQERNPLLSHLHSKAEEVKRAVSCSSCVDFSVPDMFEREYCCLNIKFRTKDELKNILGDIDKHSQVFDTIDETFTIE